MRSHDGRARADAAEPLGVRLGGVGPRRARAAALPGPGARDRRTGRRVALELELTAKGRARRETILAGYAVDRRIDARRLPGRRAVGRPRRSRRSARAARDLGPGPRAARASWPGAAAGAGRRRAERARRRAAAALGAAGAGRGAGDEPRHRRPRRRPYWTLRGVAGVLLPAARRAGRRGGLLAAARRRRLRRRRPRCGGAARAARRRRGDRAPATPSCSASTSAAAGACAERPPARRPRADRRRQRRRQVDHAAARSSTDHIRRGRPVVAIDMKGSPAFARELAGAAAAAGRPFTVWTPDGPEPLEPARARQRRPSSRTS